MDDDRVMHAMSIDDMYHVERVLARGVTGVTELVTIEGSGPFVRKKIPLDQANRSVWTACADCGSNRLPHVEAMYELPDEFVVVYDFVPGDSVEKVVQSAGHLPVGEAISLARDLCEAAGALHVRGIVHRDIAPTNVVVASDGAHLIDLGIARMHKDGASRDDDALGTWGYAAPEQYGFAPTDPRSDVYAIGRVLAYMLCGVAPADEGFDAALADASRVPPALRAVIDKACAFEPSARYQSAEELSQALEEVLAKGESRSPQEPVEETEGQAEVCQDPAGGRHRRGLAVVLALVAIAIVAGIGAFVLVRGGSGDGAPDGAGAASGATNAATETTGVSGAANASGTVATSDASGILQVSSLQWGVASDGNVVFLVGLTNTSDSSAANYSDVILTGYDAQGKVTFSSDLYFPLMRPGDTLHMAEYAMDASQTVDVKAQVTVPSYGIKRWSGSTGEAFDTANVSYLSNALGGSTFTGTVTTLADVGDDGTMVRVDVVMRDAGGSIVGYAVDYPNRPAVGEMTSFQAAAVVDSDDVASYEVYVSPWG